LRYRAERRKMRKKLIAFVKEWRMEFAVLTLVLYIVAIPVTVIIFPANSLWLALLILFSGVTTTLTTLGDLLVTSETHDELDS